MTWDSWRAIEQAQAKAREDDRVSRERARLRAVAKARGLRVMDGAPADTPNEPIAAPEPNLGPLRANAEAAPALTVEERTEGIRAWIRSMREMLG